MGEAPETMAEGSGNSGVGCGVGTLYSRNPILNSTVNHRTSTKINKLKKILLSQRKNIIVASLSTLLMTNPSLKFIGKFLCCCYMLFYFQKDEDDWSPSLTSFSLFIFFAFVAF